jgi:aminoglycoside phosphotransferase (APT) family kinase protein
MTAVGGLPEELTSEPPERLEAFLDVHGLGRGPLRAVPIGDGHSNLTYEIAREGARAVLRRPPRGPLPPSAHDVLREARLLSRIRPAGARVPAVLAACEDHAVIGAPFYVMELIDGIVLGAPAAAPRHPDDRARVAHELVDALAELHELGALDGFGRAEGYLERQLRRFRGLLESTATRPLPELERVADELAAALPASGSSSLVHGDYRLGNVMFASAGSPRLVAVLDWELATTGDPLADLGYLTAMWAQADDPADPMLDLAAVTRLPGFPARNELAWRYAERTGRSLGALPFYQALAVWKSAIFLEGSYRRYLAGNTADPYFARLESGVPALARRAQERLAAL